MARVLRFSKNTKNPEIILKEAFKKYITTIDSTVEDANILLENLGCYYYMRRKVPALVANRFDLIRDMPDNEKQLISSCMKFLHQEMNNTNNA